MTATTYLSIADMTKINGMTANDIVVHSELSGAQGIDASLNLHYEQAFALTALFPNQIQDRKVYEALTAALGNSRARKYLNRFLGREPTKRASMKDRALFYATLAKRALEQFMPESLAKLGAQTQPSAPYRVCSLAQMLWSHGACHTRSDAYISAALLLFDELSITSTPSPRAKSLHLHEPRSTVALATDVLAQTQGATLVDKLFNELQVDLYAQGKRYRAPTRRELEAGHVPDAKGKVFLAGPALNAPAHQVLDALLQSSVFDRFGQQLAAAANESSADLPFKRALAEQVMLDVISAPDKRRPDHVLDYPLFTRENEDTCLRDIRLDLINSVQTSLEVSPATAEIASELLMRHRAPELLLHEAPDNLRYMPDLRWANARRGASMLLAQAKPMTFAAAQAQAKKEFDSFAERIAKHLHDQLKSTSTRAGQPALNVLADTLEGLLPANVEYEDASVSASIKAQLALWSTQQKIKMAIESVQLPGSAEEDIPIHWDTVLSHDDYAGLLQKLVLHILSSDQETWVPVALEHARLAPGMQVFSFATTLQRQRPSLGAASCLRLSALALRPSPSAQPLSPLEPLFDSSNLKKTLPRYSHWCAITSIDEWFASTGLELLCELKDGEPHLLMPASHAWQLMMRSYSFTQLLHPLLSELGWFGAAPGESASPRVTQSLASRAIVGHFLGPGSMAERFQDHWVSEHSHVELRQQLNDDLSARNPGISPAALELFEYLLLREIAPELLVTDIPDWLYYGRSLQSVALIHGARLLEALLPGASCRATFDKVVTLANDLSSSSDDQVQRLWSSALVVPALRYAKVHGALADLTGDDIGQATPQQITRALEFIVSEQKAFAEDASQLALEPPDRKTLAEEQLSQAGVSEAYWDKSIADAETWRYLSVLGLVKSSSYTLHHTLATPGVLDDVGAPSQAPIIANLTQLIMMGDVYREGKATVPALYDQAFDKFKADWQGGHTRMIKRLFMELPNALRDQLRLSTCEVSLVSFELPSDHKATTGTQGVFIRCQPGDHRDDFDNHETGEEHFFELTPAAGALRPCSQQFNYKVALNTGFSGNIVETVSKRLENQARLQRARITPLQALDSDAYLTGTPSRSARQLETPLNGTLVPCSQRVYSSQPSEGDFFHLLATTATSHLYTSTLEKLKSAHTHVTPWEELIELEKKITDFLARTILPFYGCISDLSKGDHAAGVIVGCVFDAIGVLIPVGKFIAASATMVRTAGRLGLRAASEAMGSAIGELISHLAEQSPLLLYRDMGRLARWLSIKSWDELVQPALHWLQELRGAHYPLHMTESGVYSITQETLSGLGDRYSSNDLMPVDGTESCLVRNLGTTDKPRFKLVDPHDNLPYGPTAIVEGPALSLLKNPGAISPDHYPTRIAAKLAEEGRLSMSIDQACKVRTRYKGAGHYDFDIDGRAYHLDTSAHDPQLTALGEAPVSERETVTSSEVTCRLRRGLEETSCTPFTQLTSLPDKELLASETNPSTRGQTISQAFEARVFQLERRDIPATGQTPARTLDLLVHEGKFCKWDHAPIKGTRPVKFTKEKKLVPLGTEERTALGLPESPTYNPVIKGRLSTDRHFGLPPEVSGQQAKTINPQVPVVEVEQVCEQIADRRTLRGLDMAWNSERGIYVEIDTGKLYKTRRGPGELTFTLLTDPDEIDEYLRLSEQYRFVAERPGSAIDRDNIAKLLYATLVEKREPSLQAWLAASPSNRDYATYAQWCIDNKQRNDMLHYAENILSADNPQSRLVEETRGLISDWKPITNRNIAEKRDTIDILNELLPVQGKQDSWVPLTVSNIAQRETAMMIAMQMSNSNLAFASIVTKEGEKFVYYALAGGKRAQGLHLKPYQLGAHSHSVGETSYVDCRELMRDRTPDPSITSLPVVRQSSRMFVRPFDRHLDSERLIATILKERHSANSIDSIHVFTRMDTCRSCGGVVLPQLTLNYPDADFWVTYLDEYRS